MPYSRNIPHESRATDAVFTLLLNYPDGTTVRRLMADNADKLKDPNTVLAAIEVLQEEGKIYKQVAPGQEHHLNSIKVWVRPEARTGILRAGRVYRRAAAGDPKNYGGGYAGENVSG